MKQSQEGSLLDNLESLVSLLSSAIMALQKPKNTFNFSGGCDRISMEHFAISYSEFSRFHGTCGLPSRVSNWTF